MKEAVSKIRRVLGHEDPASVYRIWSAEETEKVFLAGRALGAVSYAAGSLSAYKFVIGVLSLAVAKGLNLQTETPALQISQAEGGWIVNTPRGPIHTGKVVLATNGYTAHLQPGLQGVIVPLRGHVTAQRPGSRLPSNGLVTTYSFIYADAYEYMISRPQGSRFAGDVVIGGGLSQAANGGLNEFGTTDDTTADPVIISYLCDSTERYFGRNWGDDDAAGRLRHAWTGIMGFSADGFPLVGPVPDKEGLFIAASFQGHGMVLCYSAARALAEMMTGIDDEELDQWFPKPFRMCQRRMTGPFSGLDINHNTEHDDER
jgi:glycine/D-amino acid oxidase-like deaminating enzyme